MPACAEIFKQSMGAKEPIRNRVVVLARQSPYKPFKNPGIDSQPGGIHSSISIPGLYKCLQIRALAT
jgi:hypothetical protein